MKIVCTSDTHGHLPLDIPECDLFIHAGDFTPVVDHSRQRQKNWFREDFYWWTHDIRKVAKNGIFIAGNHDFVARTDEKMMHQSKFTYLNNNYTEIGNQKIWGSPYSTPFGDWAFMRDEEGLYKIWQTIPDDTTIVIVHGPPYGYGDRCRHYEGDPHQGSKTLWHRLTELPELQLVVCGHIHEDSGVFTTPYCPVANVSYVDLSYKPRGYFYNFDL